jgi:hypothetical protein
VSRSPLAYPLSRSADTDVGGAADLQTDVMRFMAILALCLVAIFALVQSIPLAPAPVETPMAAEPAAVRSEALPAETVVTPDPVLKPVAEPSPEPVVVLTRPELKRKLSPSRQTATPTTELPTPREETQPPVVASPTPTEPETEGFTLRFASDAALMRAVAAHKVGVYAIEPGRARRMTVSESRIGFWDASMPNSFHEMEPETVPAAVTSALARTGAATDSVNWGVTLPGGMTSQLDALMAQHRGGALIIGARGEIHWEATQ